MKCTRSCWLSCNTKCEFKIWNSVGVLIFILVQLQNEIQLRDRFRWNYSKINCSILIGFDNNTVYWMILQPYILYDCNITCINKYDFFAVNIYFNNYNFTTKFRNTLNHTHTQIRGKKSVPHCKLLL